MTDVNFPFQNISLWFALLNMTEQTIAMFLTYPSSINPASSSAVAITQGGAIQLANNGTDGMQGMQTLTMTNAAGAQQGTTILQYAQTSDGQQILVPSNQVVMQGEKVLDHGRPQPQSSFSSYGVSCSARTF